MKHSKNITITLNGNKGNLTGSPLLLDKIFEKWKIKHPNAYYLKISTRGKFDGYIKYISHYGDFRIGLFPSIYNDLIGMGAKIKVVDNRLPISIKPQMVYSMGKYQLRDNQQAALKHLIRNKIAGNPFYIGVMNCATNFGKTLLMSAVHQAFDRRLKTIVLLNNSQVFKQAKLEYKDYLPGEDIKFVQGKDLSFGNFTVAMVPTLAKNIKKVANALSEFDIVLVDEADVADNKSYRTVIERLYNARVRLGLSGSIYLSKLKKDIVHNTNLRAFFGDELHITSKQEMVEKGYSTPVIVKIIPGNKPNRDTYNNYLDAYKGNIINNADANNSSLERALYNIKYNRLPAIIVTKYIEHSEKLFEFYKNDPRCHRLRIYRLDHKAKDKDWVIDRFKKGFIDILIITYIVKRGLNLPKSVYMQNASGSDSEEDILQLMGRMERRNIGKNKSYIDDLYYYGQYIERHSKHRIKYYKNTKMKLINRLKK